MDWHAETSINEEMLRCETQMVPLQRKSQQYLIQVSFAQNGPSQQLATQVCKYLSKKLYKITNTFYGSEEQLIFCWASEARSA
jgi:hypothetical protein